MEFFKWTDKYFLFLRVEKLCVQVVVKVSLFLKEYSINRHYNPRQKVKHKNCVEI